MRSYGYMVALFLGVLSLTSTFLLAVELRSHRRDRSSSVTARATTLAPARGGTLDGPPRHRSWVPDDKQWAALAPSAPRPLPS